MTRIALATSRDMLGLAPGDRLLRDELRSRGCAAEPVVWDDASVAWRACDAVVIRSCWDYHLAIDAFGAWLDRLARSGIAVINPLDLVRWNLHKGYLLGLPRAGARIPPTRVVRRGDGVALRQLMQREGWRDAVVKPAISASGYRTALVEGEPREDDERRFAEMVASGDVLAQRYVPEIRERGEWSLVFFAGRFSHAVRKRAAQGEFRVQIEWGGTVETATPPQRMIAEAQALLEKIAPRAAYARVDGVDADAGFLLMEVELIEPELFVDRAPGAAARFADAVELALRRR